MLDGAVTDLLESEALNYHNDYVDIYSASWGPSDNGKTTEGPGKYANEALRKGVQQVLFNLTSFSNTCTCILLFSGTSFHVILNCLGDKKFLFLEGGLLVRCLCRMCR